MTDKKTISPPRAALPLFAALALSACSGFDLEHRDPALSGMELNTNTVPEARVSVPMPPPEPMRMATRAENASLWQSGSQGFFGDRRASEIGDLLTINIEIDDEADLSNESERRRASDSSVDTPLLFGLGGGDDPALAVGSNSSTSGEGSIARREEINLKVAAMVIDKLPNGNLVVAGRQEVKVNFELRELRVAGIIRPVDIEMDNTIPYDKIAEARIAYGGRGQLTTVQQPRYGSDALEVILPF